MALAAISSPESATGSRFVIFGRGFFRLGMLVQLVLALQVICIPQGSHAAAGNKYPLVLVHGFTGWGPGEMGGINYWGGHTDIAKLLSDAGSQTYTGVVGPLSSNWDRACELYSYIKGGRVDYGAEHAARYGHARYGRTFPGLLPDWGLPGAHAKIHLVGHSQGGQTIRVLTSLLANGDEAERMSTPAAELHPLFSGRPGLVRSVTSLSSPHDGSTLAIMMAGEADYLMSWLLELASYIGNYYDVASQYDFKLDQWDIRQHDGESNGAYRERLQASDIWNQRDISIWDLQPVGASELNQTYPAVDSVYYFSWATQDTVEGKMGKGFLPAVGMNLALVLPAVAIGRYRNEAPGYGLPALNESWWPNDGVVNSLSMSGPKIGSRDHIVNVEKDQAMPVFQPGRWYFMGLLQGWDHLDVIGQQTTLDYTEFYLRLGKLLAELPGE